MLMSLWDTEAQADVEGDHSSTPTRSAGSPRSSARLPDARNTKCCWSTAGRDAEVAQHVAHVRAPDRHVAVSRSVLVGLAVAILAVLALRNVVFFRLGVRNAGKGAAVGAC